MEEGEDLDLLGPRDSIEASLESRRAKEWDKGETGESSCLSPILEGEESDSLEIVVVIVGI